MRALGRSAHSSIATMVGYAIQRGIALFLFVVTLAGILVPPVSVYAATANNASDPTAIDTKSPPALHESKSGTTPAADYANNDQLGAGGVMSGLAANGSKPSITPHELIDKRTESSTTYLNADGTFTQTNYFSPHFYKTSSGWQDVDTTLVEDKNAADSDNI